MDRRRRSRIDAVSRLKPTINNAFVTAMIDHVMQIVIELRKK